MSYVDQENDKEVKEVIVDVKIAENMFNQLADFVSGLKIETEKQDKILEKIDYVEYELLGKSKIYSHEERTRIELDNQKGLTQMLNRDL